MTKFYTPNLKFHLKSNGEIVVADRITCDIDFNNVNTGIGGVCPSKMLHISGGNVGLDCKSPSEKLEITQPQQAFSEVDEAKFIEELKALQYDLERTNNIETKEKLVEKFITAEFKRIYFMKNRKNKQLDFFIKTWDL